MLLMNYTGTLNNGLFYKRRKHFSIVMQTKSFISKPVIELVTSFLKPAATHFLKSCF